MDELDRDLSRLLKNWSAEVSPPADGRQRLLRSANLVQHEQNWRINVSWFMPFFDHAQGPSNSENYFLPRGQAVHWYFQLAANTRITE